MAEPVVTEEDRAAVNAAVSEAEKGTAAEIVAVLASASDAYERAEDLAGLWGALGLVAAAWWRFQGVREEEWAGHRPVLDLVAVLVLFAAGFILGIAAARLVPGLKRLCAPRRVLAGRVLAAARESFVRFHVHRTKEATGIVIYVSLFERMAAVVADDRALAALEGGAIEEIRDLVLQGVRAGRIAEGFSAGIRRAGEILARRLPIRPGDVNELPNELRILG